MHVGQARLEVAKDHVAKAGRLQARLYARDPIEVKGKGEMKTFFLEARR